MNAAVNELLIDKAEIPQLNVARQDVLTDAWSKVRRTDALRRAMMLGNLHKQKVRISFQSTDGPRAIETTVWGVTDRHVQLKGGISLPVACIRSVAFC